MTPTLSGTGYLNEAIFLKSNPSSQVIWKKNGVYVKNGLQGNIGNAQVLAGSNQYKANQLASCLGIMIDKAESFDFEELDW